MLVKSTKKGNQVSHFKVVFQLIKEHRPKLNLEKCAFRVSSGKFLGHIFIKRGKQVQAQTNLIHPQCPTMCSLK